MAAHLFSPHAHSHSQSAFPRSPLPPLCPLLTRTTAASPAKPQAVVRTHARAHMHAVAYTLSFWRALSLRHAVPSTNARSSAPQSPLRAVPKCRVISGHVGPRDMPADNSTSQRCPTLPFPVPSAPFPGSPGGSIKADEAHDGLVLLLGPRALGHRAVRRLLDARFACRMHVHLPWHGCHLVVCLYSWRGAAGCRGRP